MGYAKTVRNVSPSFSAICTFLALDGWHWEGGPPPAPGPTLSDNPCYGSISGFNGSATFDIHQHTQQEDYDSDGVQELVTRSHLKSAVVAGGSSDDDDAEIGIEGHDPWYSGLVNFWVWPDAEKAMSCGVTSVLANLHKMRDAENKPAALSYPCHSLHLVMHRKLVNSVDATTDATAGGASASGSYTIDGVDLGYVSISIGLTDQPLYQVPTGVVIKFTEIRWELGGVSGYVDFSGWTESAGGCMVVGGLGTVTFHVVDSNAIPGDGQYFSATRYVPVVIDYDLDLRNWGIESGGRFRIPANELQGDATYWVTVDSPYVARVWYHDDTWTTPALNRPFQITVQVELDPWMISQDEDVTPPDASCVIEDSGLNEDPDEPWMEFKVLREQEIAVQLPADAGGTLPSAWIATQQCSVAQVGQQTTVTINAAATYAIIARALVEDYFSAYTTKGVGGGCQTYGIPACYQYLKHQPGSDIWNWENLKYVMLRYTSEIDQEIEIVLGHREATVYDDHLTGSERETNLDISTVTVVAVRTATCPTAAVATEVVMDLCEPTSPWLQHVDTIIIRGLVGQAGVTTEFTIEDLVLRQHNPTTLADTGQTFIKITNARPNSGGLPISYTAITAVAEGDRCCRPPDQIVTLCDEAGIDFVERITGRESGAIGDHLHELAYAGTTLNRQEGWQVQGADDTPPPWDPTATEYTGAFVDGDNNDMLGGLLYVADVIEQLDQVAEGVPEPYFVGTSFQALPVRPRIGESGVVSGIPITVMVRHILRGSLHGLGRQSNGSRAFPGVAVELWEPGYASVSSHVTDDWGHLRFPGAGARENRSAGYRRQGGNVIGAWQVYNRIRQWIEPTLELTGPPALRRDIYGRIWVAFAAGGHIYCAYHTHHTLGWSERFEVGDTEYQWRDPDILTHLDGTLTIRATDVNYTLTRTWESRDDGRTWDAVG